MSRWAALALQMLLACGEAGLGWYVLFCVLPGKEKQNPEDRKLIAGSLVLLGALLSGNRMRMFFSPLVFLAAAGIHFVCGAVVKRGHLLMTASVIFSWYSVQALLDFVLAFASMPLLGEAFLEKVFTGEGLFWQAGIYLVSRLVLALPVLILGKKWRGKIPEEEYRLVLAGTAAALVILLWQYYQRMVAFMLGQDNLAGGGMSLSILASLVVLSIIIILFLNNRVTRSENQYLAMQEDLMMQKYQRLEEEIEKNRCMVHDMRHDVTALREYAASGDYEGLRQYLDSMSQALASRKRTVWTQNTLWDLVLQQKKEEAERAGIAVTVQAELIPAFPFSQREGCALFGNLLDNAMEACGKIEGEEKWIRVRIEKKNQMLFLEVGNSIGERPKEKNGKLPTTKKGGLHGYGMKSVRRIVEKYGGVLSWEAGKDSFAVFMSFFES